MKDLWFNIPKVLGAVLMLVALSLIGLGNPRMIPFFALFFLALFAVIYLLNKNSTKKTHTSSSGSALASVFQYLGLLVFLGFLSMLGSGQKGNMPFFALFFAALFAIVFLLVRSARNRERSAKSGSALMTIFQILGLILFIAVLSAMGLIHGIIGYLAWLVVMIAIFGLIFLFVRKQQNHSETSGSSPLASKIVGVALAVLAVLLPFLLIKNGGVVSNAAANPVMVSVLTILAILVFLGLILLALALINKKGSSAPNRYLGYLLVIIAAVLPGVLVLLGDKTSTGFAQTYFAALLAMILAYSALGLISKEY